MTTILATLHPADLFRNPKMRLPVRQDWRKVKLFLEGKWPQPVPPYARVPQEKPGEWVAAWVDGAVAEAPFVVIDTEYARDTKHLTVLGMGYPNAPLGCQVWLDALDPVDRAELKNSLKRLVGRVPAVFQNTMADVPVLEYNLGLSYTDYCRIDDTMLAHAVLWSEWEHTLEFMASVYGVYPKMKHLAATDPSLYNWGDVVDTICVHQALTEEFRRDPLSYRVYKEQSLPLIPIILERAKLGIRVNKPRVKPAVEDYRRKIAEAENLAIAAVGWPINLDSEKQLKAYLYERRGYPVQVDKDTKKPSINGDAIAALRAYVGPTPDAEEEELNGLSLEGALRRIDEGADPVLEARTMFAAATQIMSHYLAPLIKGNGQLYDRIYPEIKIHAQASGRWSITNPPLQQLPADIADIICPDVGRAWARWDWDQIELRLLAALAHDETYLESFARGLDVHTINACDIFALPKPPHLSGDCPHSGGCIGCAEWRAKHGWAGKDDIRRVFAKRFVYRLNYGGDPRSAGDIPGARQLGLGKEELVDASNRYLAAHPAMAAWRVRAAADARSTRMSRTFMGRRRRLLGDGAALVREAYNHPMQGGVSDVLNLTVIEVKRRLPEARLVYTCHDAATWDVPIEHAHKAQLVMQDVIARPWDIGGVKVTFPAKFKPLLEGAEF